MRWLKQLFRKLRALKYFILPTLAIAFELRAWPRQDIPKRGIFCSAVVFTIVLSLIWWQSKRARRGKVHLHGHHRRRDDYR
jgi:hypothetical protein